MHNVQSGSLQALLLPDHSLCAICTGMHCFRQKLFSSVLMEMRRRQPSVMRNSFIESGSFTSPASNEFPLSQKFVETFALKSENFGALILAAAVEQ
jgi:hypothetical protein